MFIEISTFIAAFVVGAVALVALGCVLFGLVLLSGSYKLISTAMKSCY